MKIDRNKVVELCYELEVDGEIADRTTREKPLDYIHGTGSLLEKFEENITGLEPGEKFAFTLAPLLISFIGFVNLLCACALHLQVLPVLFGILKLPGGKHIIHGVNLPALQTFATAAIKVIHCI